MYDGNKITQIITTSINETTEEEEEKRGLQIVDNIIEA